MYKVLLEPWKVQLLSRLTLSRNQEYITHFPTEKIGLLLAYLAAFPEQSHTREALVECFWPDSAPEAGRVSLRHALASLRRLLEPLDTPTGTVLTANRTFVALNPAYVRTDLEVWEQRRKQAGRQGSQEEQRRWLEQAVAAYGGDFLPQSSMEWAVAERQFRHEQFLDVLLRLTDVLMECQENAQATDVARQILHLEPLHEEAQARLMRLLALQGKPGRARRLYTHFCHLLQEQLGTVAAPELQALYSDLDNIAQKSSPAVRTASVSMALPASPVPLTEASSLPRLLPCLPPQLTRFFGREAELDLLGEWLRSSETRLITLTGVGGIGKTRLAVAAAQQAAQFDNAITFVSLADVEEAGRLLPAILQALCLPAADYSDPMTRIAALLNVTPHLLILDNFEQIAVHAAQSLLTLLEQVVDLVCLITSRRVLNLPGERELPLAPLPVPAIALPPEELITSPTAQMLVDRMRLRRADFQITRTNAEAFASLCERLEGVPLAIELAGGWARDLTVAQMRDRLTHRFDLLVSRQHGVSARHHSLRAAMEFELSTVVPHFAAVLPAAFRVPWRLAERDGGDCSE